MPHCQCGIHALLLRCLHDREGNYAALQRLVDATGSFPSIAKWLMKLPVDDEVRKAVEDASM